MMQQDKWEKQIAVTRCTLCYNALQPVIRQLIIRGLHIAAQYNNINHTSKLKQAAAYPIVNVATQAENNVVGQQ